MSLSSANSTFVQATLAPKFQSVSCASPSGGGVLATIPSGATAVPEVAVVNGNYRGSLVASGESYSDPTLPASACIVSQNAGAGTLASLALIGSNVMVKSSTGRTGTFTADNGTGVDVPCAGITANSVVLLSVKTATGANAGAANVVAITAGTGFQVKSGVADTSVYNYVVLDIAV